MASSSEAVHDPLPGRRLADRYVVERLLARGGMAHVYQARDERLDRPVAIKVLASPYADDPAYVTRFLDEARIAASITHPNLAHVYDSGEDDGVQFIVLELLEGYRSLRDELTRSGRLPPSDVVRIGREVLAGLAPLHAHGLVHCDVKPANVLMRDDGVKLIDFGIARPLNRPSAGPTSIGSLHSMSPEQLRGDGLTPASDVFAVGVILYQALTGRVPFAGETPAAVAAAHAAGPPRPPAQLVADVPSQLDAAVVQALSLDPAHRFTTAEAMDTALATVPLEPMPGEGRDSGPETLADDETTTFEPVARPAQRPGAQRPSRPSPGLLMGIVTLVAVSVAVVVIALNGLGGPQAPADATTDTPTPRPTRSVEAGTVEVPNTIGMSEQDAEAAAQAAGLTWRLEWVVDASKEPGVYDQDPQPGKRVDEGAPFVMYAYRTK